MEEILRSIVGAALDLKQKPSFYRVLGAVFFYCAQMHGDFTENNTKSQKRNLTMITPCTFVAGSMRSGRLGLVAKLLV